MFSIQISPLYDLIFQVHFFEIVVCQILLFMNYSEIMEIACFLHVSYSCHLLPEI